MEQKISGDCSMEQLTPSCKIAIYTSVVDTVSANEARRQQFSSVYITLLSAGLAILGTGVVTDPIFLASSAIPLSFLWYYTLFYFKKLAEAKFHAIGLMEKDIGYQPFAWEWEQLKSKTALSLSWIELTLPIFTGVSALCYITYRLIRLRTHKLLGG